MKKSTVIISIGIVIAVGIALMYRGQMQNAGRMGRNISLPALTPQQAKGEALYNANCAACHGTNAVGSNVGPTLIHKYYEPGHHGDGAFFRAVKYGVRQHHWRFGNMPPLGKVTQKDVAQIITYVRAIQFANGIK